VIRGKVEATKTTVLEAVKKAAGFNLAEVKEESGYQLYSQKGNYTRLGIYITHFSILVILLGAIIGIKFGFKGFLPLAEGDVSNVIETARGRTIPLGFDIRCDKFEVDFYGETDMPKAYKSWLTVIKDGKEVMQKMIEVNNPLTYDGTTFYQSSYGIVPGGIERGVFVFKVTPKDGKAEVVNLRFGGDFTIPGTKVTGKVEDFSPALGFNQSTGKPFTYAEQMDNPAVFVSFFEGGKRIGGGWILKRYPETGKLPQGGTVVLADIWGLQYTGLQVRKDPGVWVVYLGCIAMAIGLFIAFFMSHRKIWLKLTEEKNNTRVIVGASANKNRQSFERKIDKLTGLLSKHREGGK
jgi:cytochrome c biogenesis protein